ncbi:acyl dehydratase [Salmonella enterica subsp. enterica serovar Heidelberg]|uniref:acyl dehydratase n=1 Tax=Salmonella enterica TaxID=28901 RepID=UPI000B9E3059|nr:acyl dehydratase [Salmonella enterica]OZI02374.1 acyl dehydratase [Salmonella enterica subsp. enterica serovar Heidelberg]
MQYTDIQIWQPGILRNTDYLNPGPAKLLAATLDKDIKIFKEGGDLSADGHPIKGHFLPPVSAGLLRKKL